MKRKNRLLAGMLLAMMVLLVVPGAMKVSAATTTETTASKAFTGLVNKKGKLYYYKNGSIVKDKYGIYISGNFYQIARNGVCTKVSTSRGLAGIRLEKCGRNLIGAFRWSSTNIKYASVKEPAAGTNRLDYYATYGFRYGKGDCYVMAATFCQMARVLGYQMNYIEGKVPTAVNANGQPTKFTTHAWCVNKTSTVNYVYDPNFAYTYRNSANKPHSGYKFTYGTKGTYQYYSVNGRKMTK